MKTLKRLLLVVTILSLLLLTACDLQTIINNFTQEITPDPQNGQTNLQLLRIETADDTSNNFHNGYFNQYGSQLTMTSVSARNSDVQVEEIENTYVNLVAVIKNEDRASFIDMVVYNSQTDKTVVYNEGNGSYQCSSETVYEDGMWVTNIRFSINAELVAEDFYFEIQEIKFLRNNADEKADLNTLDVRRKDFRFTTEYFDNQATAMLKQNIELPNFIDIYYSEFNLANKTVHLHCKAYVVDDDEIVEAAYIAKNVEIIVPETLLLQYYENRELKSGEFTVAEVTLDHIQGESKWFDRIYTLTTNVSPNLINGMKVYNLVYSEGTKICVFPYEYGLLAGESFSIPSTCEEFVVACKNHPDHITVNYNGTMENFKNIKGATEFISWMSDAGKNFQIVCTDGTISTGI